MLDAGAGYAEMAAHGGLRHIPVAELEDIADEHMIAVEHIVKAVGPAEKQIAAAAPEPVFHLVVYRGDELISGNLDDREMEFYLLLQQLCEYKVFALVEGLVIKILKLMGLLIEVIELLGRYFKGGLPRGILLDHASEIAYLVIFLFIKLGHIVAAVLYPYIVVFGKLFKSGLDRRSAYAQLLCYAAFAYAASRHQ